MPDGRVLIATGGGPLDATPFWTRFDNLTDCRCSGYDINRGRQSEFEVTDTGRARVFFKDRNQTTNDTNLVGKQIVLQAYDPVAEEWVPQFRGLIDNITTDVQPVSPNRELSVVQFECVDIFDYLGSVRFLLDGTFGDATLKGSVVYAAGPVDDRLNDLLANAGLDTDMKTIFTGNVDVNETQYDSSDNILSGCRDAADAEFPGIANIYVDRRSPVGGGTDGTGGRVVFHGRFARFDPEGTAAEAGAGAWDFTRWQAATREDIGTTRAQIAAFSFSYPKARLINSYVAWPRMDEEGYTFKQSLIETLERKDAGSISSYGYHGRSAPDLIIKEHKTNGNTGAEECGLFADFYIANYADPRRNVETVTLKSVWPHFSYAPKTWETMLNMDISDVLQLTIDEAGVAAENYYIEGISTTVRPLNPQFDYVEVTPNLSPASYYGTNVFEE